MKVTIEINEGEEIMKVTIEINMDNAAFDDGHNGRSEVARILRRLADDVLRRSCTDMTIRDINGNSVGHLRFTK